jgi:plastocyanin
MNRAVVAIVIVVVLIIGGLALANKNDNKNTPAANNNSSNSQNQTQPSNNSGNNSQAADQSQANTITYSNNGFSPSSLTVKSGTTITIKNTSSNSLQFSSDPHPVHTDDPELNLGVISPGQSQTLTVTKTGTHGYHNHLNPSDTGTIIVQ